MFKAKNLWIIHLLGWILFISLPVTIISREPGSIIRVGLVTSAHFWAFVLVYCFLFYINLFVLVPRLFLRQRYLLYAAISIIGFSTVYISQPFENLIFKRFHRSEWRSEIPPGPRPPALPDTMPPPNAGPPPNADVRVDFVSIVLFVIVWVAGLAINLSRQWRSSEQRAVLSEAEKAQAELAFFKAQINPHFLFNTLNNIYALAITGGENAAPSILKLSQMMRYITEEATEDYVLLYDELACLENYISLQKLRLNAKTDVQFERQGDSENVKIAPLLLINFVENAFKYGVSGHFESVIKISVTVSEEQIDFSCQNIVFGQIQDPDRTGVGINNVKKRLDYLYKNRHTLAIIEEDGMFIVKLKLKTR